MTDIIHTLLVITITQLTLSGINPTLAKTADTIQPPMDKRYSLFNFIATKVNEEYSHELIRKAVTIYKILQYGNSFLETQNYERLTHRDVKNDLDYIGNAIEKLRKDKLNCDLQREMNDNLILFNGKYDDMTIKQLFNTDDKETMERFQSIHNEYTLATRQEFKASLNELYAKLPAIIEHFMQSLTEFEKQENEALLNWCQDFRLAQNSRQKYFVFQRFSTYYLDEESLNGGAGGNRDCKWERSHFEEFIHKMLLWAQPSIPGFS